jgi:hypothetical protein
MAEKAERRGSGHIYISDEGIVAAFRNGMFIHQIERTHHVSERRVKTVLRREGLYP